MYFLELGINTVAHLRFVNSSHCVKAATSANLRSSPPLLEYGPQRMHKFRILIAESVFPEDFHKNDREGQVVEAIARVLHWESEYKIALNTKRLLKAIQEAAANGYDILHISCHGDKEGIQLTDETELSWDELAAFFQENKGAPSALIMSSCVGGDHGIARAFRKCKRRPDVIFGSEAPKPNRITFPGACVSWPVLYTSLARSGLTRDAFKDAVTKMNFITKHKFVYRRWHEDKYRRYPSREDE
jgi:hypothetical protein